MCLNGFSHRLALLAWTKEGWGAGGSPPNVRLCTYGHRRDRTGVVGDASGMLLADKARITITQGWPSRWEKMMCGNNILLLSEVSLLFNFQYISRAIQIPRGLISVPFALGRLGDAQPRNRALETHNIRGEGIAAGHAIPQVGVECE